MHANCLKKILFYTVSIQTRSYLTPENADLCEVVVIGRVISVNIARHGKFVFQELLVIQGSRETVGEVVRSIICEEKHGYD